MSVWLLPLQAADGGGAGGGAAAGQPDPHAAAAGGFPEDHQPAGHTGPAVPAEQLPVRPAEPATLDRKHRQDQQRVGLRVEPAHGLQLRPLEQRHGPWPAEELRTEEARSSPLIILCQTDNKHTSDGVLSTTPI